MLKNNPKKARLHRLEAKNHPLAKELYAHIHEHGKFFSDEPEYFIWDVGEDYMVMYSRVSHNLHCYYQGYGQHRAESSIRDFGDLDELLKFISKNINL